MTYTKGPLSEQVRELHFSLGRVDGDTLPHVAHDLADEVKALEAINAELLEAMRHIESSTTRNGEVPQMHRHVNNLAHDAIAKAEGR